MKFRTGDRVRIKETTLAEMKAGFPDRPELYSSWEGELIVELVGQDCCRFLYKEEAKKSPTHRTVDKFYIPVEDLELISTVASVDCACSSRDLLNFGHRNCPLGPKP